MSAVGNVTGLLSEGDAVNQSLAIAVEQADFFAGGIEFEIRMQAGIGCIVVGPYQQIATCGNCR